MTAVLSPQPPQGTSTPSPAQDVPSSQSRAQSQQYSPQSEAEAEAEASDPSASPSPPTVLTTTESSSSSSSKTTHLTTPNTSTTPSHSSKPRSRSRQSQHSALSASARTSMIYPSSLSYALVRDFAYPGFHPLHYGPQENSQRQSGDSEYGSQEESSPGFGYGFGSASDNRRLSDPPPNWEASKGMWAAGPWGGDGGAVYGTGAGDQLPSTSFGYDSDADNEHATQRDSTGLYAKNHRKSKSLAVGEVASATRRRKSLKGSKEQSKEKRKDNSHLGTGLDSQGFFQAGATDDGTEDEEQEGSYGWDLTASPSSHPVDSAHHSDRHQNLHSHSRDQHLQNSQHGTASLGFSQNNTSHNHPDQQDESFAGPSLALYTFQPENANELALREGQIVEVGYRHGQGWLVAMDLETGEQGLVPEEYVRLLRDIEGWGEEEERGYVEGLDLTEDMDVDVDADTEETVDRKEKAPEIEIPDRTKMTTESTKTAAGEEERSQR